MPKQGCTYLGQLKVVHGWRSLSAVLQSVSVTAGFGDGGGEAGRLGRPLPDAAGRAQPQTRSCRGLPRRSLRHLAAAVGTTGGARQLGAPAAAALASQRPSSKGLSCQRRDVKQVSKAPHISAD